ncbi:short-chain dehydrogenase/reductase SDR [Halosimplex carlsbadense 2-9-1]|uniref:Short-chain dehydrogenase/reductase SDR n=1 Tax=Halosimplex carlsbadense 2-9-1 TaxID=797114 RepID=M0CR46_9EURY|nr:SDR family NAD(P)-dependent oxidoreductase [Halosimplex carlsbadense]ELZ24872.1 short-chain dehydrogenase/reductase SDR [Halosimplex carlsbadense 2-9-1]
MDPTLHDSLDGQVALVTGGNRGIGRETVRGLLDHGATVFAGVRDPDADVPEGATPVELDLTEEATLTAAVDEVTATAGGLDVLVNNAGVGGTGSGVTDLDTEAFDEVLDVNLRGATLLARAAVPHLLDAGGGRVVNLSSGVGVLSDPIEDEMPAYRISKAGLNALTVSLDRTYGSEGLIANSADPGWVATELGGPEAPRDPATGAETPVWLARFAPGSPSGLFWKDREVIEY